MTAAMQQSKTNQQKQLSWISSISVLCFSLLPNILITEITRHAHAWILWIKLALLVLLVMAGYRIPVLSKLRKFYIVLIGIHLFEFIIDKFQGLSFWQRWFDRFPATFTNSMLEEQLLRLIVALLMIGTLLLMGYKRKEIFLTPGNLSTPINPVKWLGFPKADPWHHFGGQWGIYISLGTFAFLMIGSGMAFSSLANAFPILPVILLLAAMNAFSEEMTYRASFLSTLEGPLNRQQANLLAAAFFGMAHFYGVPYGVVGVLMASFLGWILGKAMLETRGLFWAWFIHYLQDIIIFTFLAIGTIQAGG